MSEGGGGGEHEGRASFIYDSITWIHDVDGIEYEDNFGVVS